MDERKEKLSQNDINPPLSFRKSDEVFNVRFRVLWISYNLDFVFSFFFCLLFVTQSFCSLGKCLAVVCPQFFQAIFFLLCGSNNRASVSYIQILKSFIPCKNIASIDVNLNCDRNFTSGSSESSMSNRSNVFENLTPSACSI